MFEIGIRPSGSLYLSSQDADDSSHIEDAFSDVEQKGSGISAGLCTLATTKSANTFSSSLRYWRKIASHYLNQRCQQQSALCEPNLELSTLAREEFLLTAPPMHGAEYLTDTVIDTVWVKLDQWLCQQVKQHYAGSLADFLYAKAPHWHQVGRVCFHLAENKQDPNYPFAFMATYAARISDDGRVRFQALGKALQEYAGQQNKQALIRLLSPIDLAAKQSTAVQQWLSSGEIYHPQAWTPQEAYAFIQQVPLYEECGIIVRLPDWWKKRAKPQVAVTIDTPKQSLLNINSLMDFKIQTVLAGSALKPKELQALLDSEENLVFFKNQWVEVDHDKLQQALAHWQNVEQQVAQEGISFAQGMRLLSGMPVQMSKFGAEVGTEHWAFVNSGKKLKKQLEKIRSPENIAHQSPGKALKATLRPYQSLGVNWLSHLTQLGLGACLADDMGLGKTLQVIALLLTRAQKHARLPSLLVLPASLINNWKSEIEKFAPSIRCHFIHPAFLDSATLQSAQEDLAGKQLAITTYGMLARQSWLLEQSWQLVILDEAQAIKNSNTQQTKTVKQLKAQARIALTGTPIENSLSDLWSLFDFICPGLLGNASAFKKYIKALDNQQDNPYGPLRQLISPYILRRLKSDKSLIADLPDKTEMNTYCGLSKRQAVLYENSVKELQKSLEIESEQSIQRRGLVLSYLLRFKQICNHPAQWQGDGAYKPDASGKFTRLAELAEEIAARQEKVLVFTQFKDLTQVLADFLATIFSQSGLVLHGGTTIAKRKEFVEAFQREDGPPFFVLSLKAGGTGLNLTAASHVIHFDRWWNPAVENQATDRAYRIGQKRNVLVHKFVCKGTIEEKIDAMLHEKSTLTAELLGQKNGGEKMLTELTDDELINLVSLDLKQSL
ncbi:MAG: SNF2 family DNA or RNA helicase [Flavobacteriales bacterium]|jgi:SNF2 family DNA or RNA helicase